jgi:uncharacterized protein with PQ loop repeat
MAEALAPVAAGYGVLMAISPLLQIRRMLQRRSSADVSVAYLAVIELGFGLWVVYGIAIPNWALIVANSVAFTVGLLTILVALRLRRLPSAA